MPDLPLPAPTLRRWCERFSQLLFEKVVDEWKSEKVRGSERAAENEIYLGGNTRQGSSHEAAAEVSQAFDPDRGGDDESQHCKTVKTDWESHGDCAEIVRECMQSSFERQIFPGVRYIPEGCDRPHTSSLLRHSNSLLVFVPIIHCDWEGRISTTRGPDWRRVFQITQAI